MQAHASTAVRTHVQPHREISHRRLAKQDDCWLTEEMLARLWASWRILTGSGTSVGLNMRLRTSRMGGVMPCLYSVLSARLADFSLTTITCKDSLPGSALL